MQSNPAWSPDGKFIVFARSKAYRLSTIEGTHRVLLTPDECREFLTGGRTFLFDLYRIPFNDGKGGAATSLAGASNNGMSNYFAKYSPDGKWIVFCQSKSFMLLQPDSRLFITPAAGGEARLMRCNTSLMNSWHSWSSNGRWLVFSTKANGPYTRLALTHVNEQGEDTPPVFLDHLSQPDRAANIPEFVNASSGAIAKINERFVDDHSMWRVGKNLREEGDMAGAEEKFRAALAMNPRNVNTCLSLGNALSARGRIDSALALYEQAASVDPRNANAHINIGNVMLKNSKIDEAIEHYQKAVDLDPTDALTHANLANAYSARQEFAKALPHNMAALRLSPEKSGSYYHLGINLLKLGRINEAIAQLKRATEMSPQSVSAQKGFAAALAVAGRREEAIAHYQEAIRLGDQDPACLTGCADLLMQQGRLNEAIELYRGALQLQPDLQSARDSLNSLMRQLQK